MVRSKLPVIRKAVFPVAGLGTRMLPATKSIPKEMLSIVDRPAIQIVVDEAREAGIEQFIFVTGRNKTAIEDYFDRNFELDSTLSSACKSSLQDSANRSLIGAGQAIFTRQQSALGLGHAVWCARHIVGDEPFALLLPDMLMRSSPASRSVCDSSGSRTPLVESEMSSTPGTARSRETSDASCGRMVGSPPVSRMRRSPSGAG